MSSVAHRETRSARAQRTRAAIVAAAHAEFVAHGYRSTSLRDIAASAGISHPGLLRHFATKDELLAEVVAAFEHDNETHMRARIDAGSTRGLWFADLARRNETVPGYLALYAALMGEASTPSHPAHERMRDRYARLRAASTGMLREAIAAGTVAAGRDPHGESVRIAAAWDGLQLAEQYLPAEVDVAAALERYQVGLEHPPGWRPADDPAPSVDAAPVPPLPDFGGADAVADAGYRVGRERRARILQDAMTLFAKEGYGDTSLRDIAERVGVSKSALLHHFATKDDLLRGVVSERDRLIRFHPLREPADRAVDEFRALPRGVAYNTAETPGLIQVYAVLSCEAVPADHPAHAYFEERFRRAIDYFEALFRAAQHDGDLPSHRDPRSEAVWLMALWDGLQYQWLYDPASIDVAEHLAAHLDDVLPREAGPGNSAPITR